MVTPTGMRAIGTTAIVDADRALKPLPFSAPSSLSTILLRLHAIFLTAVQCEVTECGYVKAVGIWQKKRAETVEYRLPRYALRQARR